MNSMEVAQTDRRRRLEPVERDIQLKPFLRAHELEDVSLYWAPVDSFPMSFRVRTWWMNFLTRFRKLMAERDLRQENFLQFKTVTAEKSGHFMSNALDFVPVAGLGLKPGPRFHHFPRQTSSGRIRCRRISQWTSTFRTTLTGLCGNKMRSSGSISSAWAVWYFSG